MPALSAPMSLVLTPALDQIARAGTALRATLDRAYGGLAECHDIELAAIEVISNIVRHGGGATAIHLRCHCLASRIRIVVADDGAGADMTRLEARLPDDPLAGGGRGLWIIARTTDRFRYRHWRHLNVHVLERATQRVPQAANP